MLLLGLWPAQRLLVLRSKSYALPAGLTQRTIQARKATIQAAPLEKPLKMSASAVAYPHPEKVINRVSLVSASQLKDAFEDECHPCGVSLEGPQGQHLCCDYPPHPGKVQGAW